MAKKLKAKVNGQELKDGDTVTLVIQAKVTVREGTKYDGTLVKYVEFANVDASQWFEAEEAKGKYNLPGTTVVKH